MNKIQYTNVSSGDHVFFNTIAIPFAREFYLLENELNLECINKLSLNVFKLNRNPQMIALSTVCTIGTIFIASCFGKKIFDEIYDLKFKPTVRKILEKADSVELFNNSRRNICVHFSVYYEDTQTLVIVALKDKNIQHLDFNSVNAIHCTALANIQSGNYLMQVHLYLITEGVVNTEPMQFNNLDEAMKKLKL